MVDQLYFIGFYEGKQEGDLLDKAGRVGMEDGQSDPTDKTRRRSLRRRIRYLSVAGTANWKMPGAFQWRILMMGPRPLQ